MATERGGSEDGDVQLKFSSQPMTLGIWPALIAAGTTLATTYMNKDKGTGAAPGASGSGGTPGGTQFNPQFSPVMQQQQDSPGGTQSASPIQYTTSNREVPGQPSITPYPSPLPLTSKPTVQTSDQTQEYLKWGVIGLIGVVGIKAYQNKNKKRRK